MKNVKEVIRGDNSTILEFSSKNFIGEIQFIEGAFRFNSDIVDRHGDIVIGDTVREAPIDGNIYSRRDAVWVNITPEIHSHPNKSFLDSINQNLNTTSNVNFNNTSSACFHATGNFIAPSNGALVTYYHPTIGARMFGYDGHNYKDVLFGKYTTDHAIINMKGDTGFVGINTNSPTVDLEVKGEFKLDTGAAVNEFSTDGTMASNSDLKVPTEKATREYVTNHSGIPDAPSDGSLYGRRDGSWMEAANKTHLHTVSDVTGLRLELDNKRVGANYHNSSVALEAGKYLHFAKISTLTVSSIIVALDSVDYGPSFKLDVLDSFNGINIDFASVQVSNAPNLQFDQLLFTRTNSGDPVDIYMHIANVASANIAQLGSSATYAKSRGAANGILLYADVVDTIGNIVLTVDIDKYEFRYTNVAPIEVPDTTDELIEGTTNLYYTEARVTANSSVTANTTHSGTIGNPHGTTLEDVRASGNSISGNIDANNNTIVGLKTPTDDSDAATKEYVDIMSQGLEWQAAVIDSLATPPATPAEGDRYIVENGATGDWAGHDDNIATFISGAWDYYIPVEGSTTYKQSDSTYYRYDGADWQPFGSVTDHGSLTGLGNDDHLHYQTVDRANSWLSGKTTADIVEGSNLYYTEARVTANTDVAANTAARHTHSNKSILDNITDTGNGASFLANNGTYRVGIQQDTLGTTSLIYKTWVGTQAEYDALGSYSNTTLYNILD